jgi:hypothetical protein
MIEKTLVNLERILKNDPDLSSKEIARRTRWPEGRIYRNRRTHIERRLRRLQGYRLLDLNPIRGDSQYGPRPEDRFR